MKKTLNILQLCRRGSQVLGPGLRYVIWVQGCRFHCPNCETPEGQSFEPNIIVGIDELAEDIINRPNIQGITISGGEPFEQAESLSELLETVKTQRPELTTISYTGYRIEELTDDASMQFLSRLDVLIDGRYIHELNDNKGLRGSSNQRIHFLTGRLKEYEEEFVSGKRNLEMIVHDTGTTIIGLTKKDRFI